MIRKTLLIAACVLPLSACYVDPYYGGERGRYVRHDYGYYHGPAWGEGYGREGNAPPSFRGRGY